MQQNSVNKQFSISEAMSPFYSALIGLYLYYCITNSTAYDIISLEGFFNREFYSSTSSYFTWFIREPIAFVILALFVMAVDWKSIILVEGEVTAGYHAWFVYLLIVGSSVSYAMFFISTLYFKSETGLITTTNNSMLDHHAWYGLNRWVVIAILAFTVVTKSSKSFYSRISTSVDNHVKNLRSSGAAKKSVWDWAKLILLVVVMAIMFFGIIIELFIFHTYGFGSMNLLLFLIRPLMIVVSIPLLKNVEVI